MVGDHFCFTVYLTAQPGQMRSVAASTGRILRAVTAEGGQDAIRHSLGPFLAFGDHDVVFTVTCDTLDGGARFVYDLIDCINRQTPVPIVDFMKIPGFVWQDEHSALTEPPLGALAYVHVKLRDGPEYYRRDKLLTESVLSWVAGPAQAIPGLSDIRVLGGLGWDECLCVLFGTDHSAALTFAREISRLNEVSCTSTIPVLAVPSLDEEGFGVAAGTYRNADHPLEAICFASTREHEVIERAAQHGFSPTCLAFGHYSYMYRVRTVSVVDAMRFVITFDEMAPRVAHSTALLFPQACGEQQSSDQPLQVPLPPKEDWEGFRATRKTRRTEQVAVRKLRAIASQLRSAAGNPQVPQAVPIQLESAIAVLLEEYREKGITDVSLQYFMSELRSALHQRLKGSMVGAFMGRLHGLYEQYGGEQRLVIACEALLTECFRFYSEDGGGKKRRAAAAVPLFLVCFGGSPGGQADLPSELYGLGLEDRVPIVVRLPMWKYSPWMWAAGLRVVGRWLRDSGLAKSSRQTGAVAVRDVLTRRVASDEFVCNFLTKRNYKRLLAAEFNVVEEGSGGALAVNTNVADYVGNRIWQITAEPELDVALLDRYRALLSEGTVCLDVTRSKADFLAFLNAYFGMPVTDQRSARVLSAFILSLNKFAPPDVGGIDGKRTSRPTRDGNDGGA